MRSPLPRRAPLLLVVAAALLLPAGTARAQLMSTWGHPVVTFGWTPYDAVSTGHGNYPGSNGYIPGYGYYPGNGPGHYPWYDVPPANRVGGPAHAPAADPAPAPGDAIPAGAAVLRVRVPADAEVWVDGVRTGQRGALRAFVSPPLAEGHHFYYDLLALWVEDGKAVAQRRKVPVFPGDRLTVDFLGSSPAAGEEPAVLGPPRKLAP
jgi:uncharacterized protein (TIGR03000 family)